MSTAISKAFLRAEFGAVLTPDPAEALSVLKVNYQVAHSHTPVASVRYRAYLGAGSGEIVLNLTNGVLSSTGLGTRQVETLTITADAGTTSAGSLPVTVTHPTLAGSPYTVLVPLRPAVHTSAALIAAAVRAALAADAVLAVLFRISGTGAAVIITALHPTLNYLAFTLEVPTALGVTAADSANTTAGVAGATFEKSGGATEDLLGGAYPIVAGVSALFIYSPYVQAGAIGRAYLSNGSGYEIDFAHLFASGTVTTHSNPLGLIYEPGSYAFNLVSDSPATVDVLLHLI